MTTFVAVTSSNNLNEAIAVVKKVKADKYYGTHLCEISITLDKKDEIIKVLVKQVQQLSVNYATIYNQEKDTCEKERKLSEPIERERQMDNIRRVNYYEHKKQSEEKLYARLRKIAEITHQVKTSKAKPIRQRAYRVSLSENEFIEKELKEMKERELIRKSNSS
ncbi:2180_t:CDS:2 [Scutellospora calospora]|uniref:2180_t:CDS:1 n=1 Tax=Scutellospora calospora TaxID=85575 RepID=A0ACA9KIJ9_9GLOM|nr:2180_t:CDS:2 [Scutellospora calospora]